MLIEQIVELQLRGSRPAGLTCASTTGYFHDKTKISTENLQVGFHLLLKCCTRQCTLPEVGSASHKSCIASARATMLKRLRRKRFRKPKKIIAPQAQV